MTHPIDPDRLISDYEDKVAEAQRKAERIREDLDGLQVTERTSAGVTLTVNATGNPQKIDVTDALAERGGRAVSSEIMRALSSAQSKVAERVAAAMEPHLGGTEAMQRTVDALRSAHPESEENPPNRTEPPPARPRHRFNDDDDFGGSFMR